MNRLGLAVLCALLFLVWPGRPCFAQFTSYYDHDNYADAMMEAEALTEALDEFELDLDSPELEGMDEGDAWEHVERLRREKAEALKKAGNADQR